ncbi:MAG: ATP-binding protein [candidate division Zixibacteria bacterium]|nr:ATP-binding protein [candidate division Zixibacteria bacterium]
MSILNKTIDTVTFDDIQELVDEKRPEGDYLDYKLQRPKHIHELIAAFANSFGGWIILGVRAADDSNVPAEIRRIEEDNLEDTINRIILSNIHPPVLSYQCKYLPGPDDLRVFVIKIDESDLTPHATDGYTTVYLREKAEKRPYRKANLDEIEWLKNKRKKYSDTRDYLINRTKTRFHNVFSAGETKCILSEFSIMPVYPRHLFASDRELLSFLQTFSFKFENSNTSRKIEYGQLHTASESAIYYGEFNGGKPTPFYHYFECGRYGNYTHIAAYPIYEKENEKFVDAEKMLQDLLLDIYCGVEILLSLNVKGSATITYSFDQILRIWLKGFANNFGGYDLRLNSSVDNSINFVHSEAIETLGQKRLELHTQILDHIFYAMDGGKYISDSSSKTFTNRIRNYYH